MNVAVQVNSQLEPSAPRRKRATGVGASVTLRPAAGDSPSLLVSSGDLISVYVPSGGDTVTVSYTGGVSSVVPLSCPDPCQLVCDGSSGVVTFSWYDSTNGYYKVTLTLQGTGAGQLIPPGTPPPSPGHVKILPTTFHFPTPYKPPPPIGGKGPVTGGTAPTSSTSSSKTKYYVAGGVVLAAAAGAAYWKYGIKRR